MEVLSGRASDRPRPPPGRRYFQRQTSFSLSPSDMFLFRPPKPTYVTTSWPGDLCVLVRGIERYSSVSQSDRTDAQDRRAEIGAIRRHEADTGRCM